MASKLEKTSGARKVVKKPKATPETKKGDAKGDQKKVQKKVVHRKVKPNYDSTERVYAKRAHLAGPCKKSHVPKLKRNLTPGTVCVLLSGRHRGKRVIFLKQMPKSGTCLITGPYKMNGCPVKRVCQTLLLSTQLKFDLSKFKLPEHMDDRYFCKKRPSKKSSKAGKDGDIFEETKKGYELSEQRRTDQTSVDTQVLAAIDAHAESKQMICAYLAQPFQLTRGMYPHRLHF